MEKEPSNEDFVIPEDGEPKQEKEFDVEAATEEELKTRLEGLRAEIELCEDSKSELSRARADVAENEARDIEIELERRKK